MRASPRFHYAWVVLAIGTLVGFGVIGMARFGYTVVLPTMQESLGLNNTQTGILATANMIGYLALSAIGGAIAARYGPRIVIFTRALPLKSPHYSMNLLYYEIKI